MLTLDERLLVGLKVLERLRPSSKARRGSPTRSEMSLPSFSSNPLETRQSTSPDPAEPSQADSPEGLLSLEALLERMGELPPDSMILGLCDDGLPFLVDLINPAPGSLLILGDEGSGKTRLLRAVLASAALQNPPGQVSFYLAASQPHLYSDLGHLDHCRLVMYTDDASFGEVIQELAHVVESRRRDRFDGPAILLAIDDLAAALRSLGEFSVTLLYWLIRHGPRARVWTLATFSSQHAEEIDQRFLAAFRSRLVGYMAEPALAASLTGDGDLATWELKKGEQFYLPYGQEWLRFRICDPKSIG
jgi:hypothetical protein